MSTPQEDQGGAPAVVKEPTAPMKLEVVVIPVADVDRALRFYQGLGWRLDADYEAGPKFRVVQLTPPGSACSIHLGRGLTPVAPGTAQGTYLVVSDIDQARADLISRGGWTAPPQTVAATPHSLRSPTRTATGGCCRRSRSGNPDGDESA